MNIAINTDNYELINAFGRLAKEKGDVIVNLKHEEALFKSIDDGGVDAFILFENAYTPKAIDFIKKANPYIPVIIINEQSTTFTATKADIVMVLNSENALDYFCGSARSNLAAYIKNFAVLKKLTTKMADVIEFGNCSYDPTRKLLFVGKKEVKKFSQKEGGLLEILALNFGQIVKKEVIMEKIWHQSDYFVGRSLDVYTTHLRKSLKAAKINMCIKNISNVGLILEVGTEPAKPPRKTK